MRELFKKIIKLLKLLFLGRENILENTPNESKEIESFEKNETVFNKSKSDTQTEVLTIEKSIKENVSDTVIVDNAENVKNAIQIPNKKNGEEKESVLISSIKEVQHDIKKKVHEINKKYQDSIESIDNWEKQRLKEIAEEEKEIRKLSITSSEKEEVIDITPNSEPISSKIDIKNDPVIQKSHELTDKFNQLLKEKGLK